MSDWEYEIDEVGPEAEEADRSIEPGSPKLEHVIPFLIGAAMAIAMLLVSL